MVELENIDEYTNGVRKALLNLEDAAYYRSAYEPGWLQIFPENSTVYCLFYEEELVYVGETRNMRKRMNHLRNSRHHTFRRNLGDHLFKDHPEYEAASSLRSFPYEIETRLESRMGWHVKITWVEVPFGRKEIEEDMIMMFRPRFNRLVPSA